MFLSNRAIKPPCKTSTDGSRTVCRGLPRVHLGTGGVLIAWSSNGGPEPPGYIVLAHTPGRITHIDGHRAKISTTEAAGLCKAYGGTEQITATIMAGPRADSIIMDACLSNPSETTRQQVLTSLRTATL